MHMALSYNFVQIDSSGALALSERPKLKEIKKLNNVGCHRVVTILGARGEQAHQIGEEVEACGMAWSWLKVSKATVLTTQEIHLFKQILNEVYESLLCGEKVLVHCSAGLHRTGMFAYALLRKSGFDHDKSMQMIQKIRAETYEALDEKYLILAGKFY